MTRITEQSHRRRGVARANLAALALCAAALTLTPCAPQFVRAQPAAQDIEALRATPLPSDPDAWYSELDSGLRYVIKPHDAQTGQVVIRLIVRAGSLYELDGEQGAAHLTAQTVFSTSLRRDAGRAIAEMPGALARVGYRSSPTMVDFESASFTVRLPSSDAGTITTSLRFLADIASAHGLDDDAITEVQPEVVQRERADKSVNKRLRQVLMPKLFSGTRLAQHLPFCPVDELCLLSPQTIRNFHKLHYLSSEMALLIVGDVSIDLVEPLIEQEFGGVRHQLAPPPLVPIAPAPVRRETVVVSDADLTTATAELFFIAPYSGPTRTEGDLARRLTERIAAAAMTQRLIARIESGDAPYRQGESWFGPASGPIEIAVVNVQGEPGRSSQMVEHLCAEVASVAAHGFEEAELRQARATVLARLEQRALRQNQSGAAELLAEIADAIMSDSAIIAPADRLELSRVWINRITNDEIVTLARARLNPDHATLLLLQPKGAPTPSIEELDQIASAAFANAPHLQLNPEPASTIIAQMPRPGQVLEINLHPASAVSSFWLSSGAALHHLRLDTQPGRVALVVTIAGGVLTETPQTHGLTSAAAAAFTTPATFSRSSAELRRALTEHSIRIATYVEDDRVVLRIDCKRGELSAALQLTHALLSEPKLESTALEAWRWKQARHLKARQRSPRDRLVDLLNEVRQPPGDPRQLNLTRVEIDAITLPQAQAWLNKLVQRSPIEAAIVGDVSRAEALELAARYLGSISPRPRIGPHAFCDRRQVAQPVPALTKWITVPSTRAQAAVLVGISGADQRSRTTTVELNLASRILGNRINIACTQRRRLATLTISEHAPGVTFPGSGLLYVFAQTDPSLIKALIQEIENAYTSLASRGPTQAELNLVRTQTASTLAQQRRQLGAWADMLSTLAYRNASLNEILSEPSILAGVTVEDVRRTFAMSDPGADRRLRLIVEPEAPKPTAPGPPMAKEDK